MIQNDLGVNQEHEKKGDKECANWRLSVVMDGSRIMSPPGLLWGLKRIKYPRGGVFNLTHAQTLFYFYYKENFVMDIRESSTIKMKAQNSSEIRYKF